jgi:hypothetical protein
MGKFDRQIDTALRLIKQYGQTVIWEKKLSLSAPDPTKPWEQVASTALYEPYICFLPLDLQGKEFLQSLGGGEAASGAFYGLMGNVPFVPDRLDVVTRDGIKLDIESIDLLSPNGQKILYTIIFNG